MTSDTNSRFIETRKGSFKMRYLFMVAALALIVFTAWWAMGGDEESIDSLAPTFVVERGDLILSVLEGGNLRALNSQEIKCEVEGQNTIIYLVPEGSRITEKDIADGKILVKLDSSQISERLKTQEITYESANSDLIQAKEAYLIQLKQNESDIKADQLAVKFALLDLQRYLGNEIADRLVTLGEEERYEALNDPQMIGDEGEDSGLIKGASRQTKRDLENEISLALEEVTRAKNELEWTEKLHEKGYVSKNELEEDSIKHKRSKVQLEQARTALVLFKKYEFYKEAEKLLSDYEEAKQQLLRTEARARAQEAQKYSSKMASEAKFKLQKERLDEYTDQFANCEIKATTPGLVVWSNADGDMRRESRVIEEGGSVRERQSIITIPDISTMAVEVKVHETSVDRIAVGQRAKITVEAHSQVQFMGEVLKIAVLPDQQSRWLNPDLKVYSTDVSIEGTHDFLKPGMSAQVEIIMKEIRDVLFVPIQAVVSRGGQNYCLLVNNGGFEPVPVKTGDYNDIFIVITEGLDDGDVILVKPIGGEWKDLKIESRRRDPAQSKPDPAERGQPGDGRGRPTPEQIKAMMERGGMSGDGQHGEGQQRPTPEQIKAMREKYQSGEGMERSNRQGDEGRRSRREGGEQGRSGEKSP